jgi:septal ring factor EnvC (AmiA/AmiB activator)
MKARLEKAVVLTLMLACVGGALPVAAQQESERELERVRAEIADLQQSLDRQLSRRDDGMVELRTIELELMATRAELESLKSTIAEQSAHRDEIEAEQRDAAARLSGEQAALAEQVRMSYVAGGRELLKLLLSQENAADFGRMLVYYDYLNRHRSEQIGAVDKQLGRLAELAEKSDAAARKLEGLRAEQQTRAEHLENEQSERRRMIAELDSAIAASGDRIEQMRAEEAALNEVIERLAKALEEFPVNSDAPFSAQRGKLHWPVDGRLAAKFGEKRDEAGRVRWHGVLIEAGEGTVVRAIYHGRVIHAQWTPGMGLLLILDHGEGYYSLYGHNAALLKEAGDWVTPGEPIAEVGDTGGQLGAGLYFGIRLDGEPVDPADWMR